MDRKKFISGTALALAGLSTKMIQSKNQNKSAQKEPKLSLSQWALHRAIFGNSKDNYQKWRRLLHSDPDKLWQGDLHPLDFPAKAHELGFRAVEYVNSLIFGHAKDKGFLTELKSRTDSLGIKNVLVMVDEEGFIGHTNPLERTKAIENHYRWMEACAFLTCPYIRVNAFSMGPAEEQKKLAAEGLNRLAEKAKEFNLHVLVENHGGMSSNADWLVDTLDLADHELLGTVVDFDNFTFSEDFIWGDGDIYNRYIGVEKLMPYAKSVSAKTHAFDIHGFETTIDYNRMMQLVKESGFEEYICVEYEGNKMTEEEGIKATKKLILSSYPY